MVCDREDDYVRELQEDRKTAVWRAWYSVPGDPRLKLAIMDDDRPGVSPSSAWLRLTAFLAASGGRVHDMDLQFRSHRVRVAKTAANGYFFCKSLVCADVLGGAPQENFYLVGALTGDRVMVERWSVPSLIHLDTQARRLSDVSPDCLYINPSWW